MALDATGDSFNVGGVQVLAGTASLSDQFAINDTIIDAVNASGLGLVRTKADNVYVDTNSYDNSDYEPSQYSTSPNLQLAVNAASSGDIVNVAAGSYYANVDIPVGVTINARDKAARSSIRPPPIRTTDRRRPISMARCS